MIIAAHVWSVTITSLKRFLFIFIAVYFVLIGGTYYYQSFAVRVFTHLFTTALLGLWLLLRLIRKRGLPPTPLNKLLYLCLAVWLVSAFFSLDPRMALENLWFPITTLLMFFVIVDFLQSGQEKRLIEAQFLIAALVVILAGAQLGSWFFGWGFATPTVGWISVLGKDLLLPAAPPRLFVPLGVSTWLAAYTAPLAIVVGAWGFSTSQRATRNGFWLFALLLIVIMLFTGSRGGWISLGAGIAIFVGLQLLRNQRLQQWARRYAIPLLIGVALLIAAAAFALIRIGSDPRHAAGDFLRFDLWRGALQIVQDHPFLGVGPGLFGNAYRLYRDGSVYQDNRLSVAHNFYLNALAENGILGGLVMLALGFVLLRTWWKLWRGAETENRRIHLEGALAALIGFGVQSFFDTFTSLPLLLLVLGLAAYCVTRTRSRLEPVLKGSIPAALVSLAIVLAYGVGLVRSDQAEAAFNAGVVKGSLEQSQQALALDPTLHLYDLQLAYSTGLTADPTQAIAAYQHALQLEPTWDTGWINLAALFKRQNNTAQALSALQTASNIDYHNGALLLWAQLAEATDAAPASTIRDAYLHYLNTSDPGVLPLSSYWSQTDLRRQALAAYEQELPLDLRYRVVEAQDPENLLKLVPASPSSAADWWVVGQYALEVDKDPAKAEQAFTEAINRSTDIYLGDDYVSRARARVTTDPNGALRDLNIGELMGTFNESLDAVRALLAASPDEQRRLLAAAVPPQIIDQNFEGVLFAGRVASFQLLPEMHLPGPGHTILQPWYDLARSYLTAGQKDQAVNVYRAILDRAPEETAAQNQLTQLAGN